jgi:hypothetical protein
VVVDEEQGELALSLLTNMYPLRLLCPSPRIRACPCAALDHAEVPRAVHALPRKQTRTRTRIRIRTSRVATATVPLPQHPTRVVVDEPAAVPVVLGAAAAQPAVVVESLRTTLRLRPPQ